MIKEFILFVIHKFLKSNHFFHHFEWCLDKMFHSLGYFFQMSSYLFDYYNIAIFRLIVFRHFIFFLWEENSKIITLTDQVL